MRIDNIHDDLGVKNETVLSMCKTVKSIFYYDGYRVGFNIYIYIYIISRTSDFHFILLHVI